MIFFTLSSEKSRFAILLRIMVGSMPHGKLRASTCWLPAAEGWCSLSTSPYEVL